VGLAKNPDRHEWLKPGAWGCQTKRLTAQSAEVVTLPCWVRRYPRLLVSVILFNVERNEQCAVRAPHAGNDRRH
jgi:hypothetical protein